MLDSVITYVIIYLRNVANVRFVLSIATGFLPHAQRKSQLHRKSIANSCDVATYMQLTPGNWIIDGVESIIPEYPSVAIQRKQLIQALNQEADVEIAGTNKCLDHTIPIDWVMVVLLVEDTVNVSVSHGALVLSESKHNFPHSVVDVSRSAQHMIYQLCRGTWALYMKSIYWIANREPN